MLYVGRLDGLGFLKTMAQSFVSLHVSLDAGSERFSERQGGGRQALPAAAASLRPDGLSQGGAGRSA